MGRVFHQSGDDDMLVVPHSVLGQACLMIQLLQFLDLVASEHQAPNIRLSYSMITAAVNQWTKVQPFSFQITRWEVQLKGESGNSQAFPWSRRPLAPSMLTDGPPDTAESFILVQQIHSRGLQGPRALSSAVQGWN